jgi:iron uptake system component EfeO
MRAARLSVVTAVTAVTALTAVTGCTSKSDAKDGDRVISVTATDSKCETSKKEISAGHVELAIENKGSKVTEVYILFPDDRVVSERENIGPGTQQRVTAEVKAGAYEIACKPGM